MGLEEKHNSPSWTSLPEAAKVCKELVKCGCKEKHVGGHANACLFHSMHRALQLRGNLLSIKTYWIRFNGHTYTYMYLNYSMSSNYSVQVSAKINI